MLYLFFSPERFGLKIRHTGGNVDTSEHIVPVFCKEVIGGPQPFDPSCLFLGLLTSFRK